MSKKHFIAGTIALCLGMSATAAFAQSADPLKRCSEFDGIVETIPPEKIDWEKRVKFGSNGNVTVYADKNGVPTQIYVVGEAPVSTTLIAVQAERLARKEAEFAAKRAFAIWIEEHLTFKSEMEQKTIVVRSPGERSEETTITKDYAVQMASATWRGMSVYWHKRSKGRYIVVWRWSATEQRLAKMVQMLTRDADPASLKRKADMDVKDIEGTFR